MSINTTQSTVKRYFESNHKDASTMTNDVVFTVMATGQESHGQEAVLGMLNYFYHVAFEANAEPRVTIYGENNALWEGDFVGKHIGEFAGVPATGKDVRVPLSVVYDIENGKIKRGRIYFEMPALFQQLGVQ